jgi:hypothetical protein
MAINSNGFPPWVSSYVDFVKDETHFCVTHGTFKQFLVLPRHSMTSTQLHSLLWKIKKGLMDQQHTVDTITAKLTKGKIKP